MNIKIVKNGRINSCSYGMFNYFGWPTVARLKDGTIMVASSGFRTWHVDPFGKVVAFYSHDEGQTFTPPTIISDTPLDDRDAGILVLDDGRVIVTSFNNNIAFQEMAVDLNFKDKPMYDFIKAYLKQVSKKQEEKYIGSYYKISKDGYIFDDNIIKVPISSPHGPIQLKDGTIFYAGTVFHTFDDSKDNDIGYITSKDGIHWSDIIHFNMENIQTDAESIKDEVKLRDICEPHSIQLPDNRILVLFRVNPGKGYEPKMQLYYTISDENGKNFTPLQKISNLEHGGPPHLLRHSSGILICAYGYRQKPFGQRVMLSNDNGNSWQTDFVLRDDGLSWDLGYPSSIELKDGKILTVYYQPTSVTNHGLQYTIWELEN